MGLKCVYILVVFSAILYKKRNFCGALLESCPVSILRKSISGRHRPVRAADGPMTARCRFT